MPAEIIREIVRGSVPMVTEIDSETDEVVSIKGFASVETEDRSGELVPPEEFNLEQFLVSPVLLVNHEFWRDGSGNNISVGKVASLHVAKLERIPGDKENFSVRDVKTREVISKFPRNKIPNLRHGDRGLFVFAEVTQPEVAKMIQRGELGAFSWRGLAQIESRFNSETQRVQKVWKDIDLMEISVVHMPDNINSTFAVASKSAHIVKLYKSSFKSPGDVKDYLQHHNLSCDAVAEKDEAYYCRQLHSDRLELNKLSVVKMAEGVDIIVGPLKDDTEKTVDADFVNDLAGKFTPLSQISSTENEEKPMSEETKTEVEKAAEAEAAQKKSAMENFIADISKANQAALQPILEQISDAMKSVASAVVSLAPPAKEETIIEKKPEETIQKDALAEMQEVLKNTQDQLTAVQKQAEAAQATATSVATTPASSSTERDEKVETQKSTSVNPNDIFNEMFNQFAV